MEVLINLREVGVPSRNILHVRGWGWKSRFGVERPVRAADAKIAFKRSKATADPATFGTLQCPPLGAARMRNSLSIST